MKQFINFFYDAPFDAIGNILNEYRERVIDNLGVYINKCLRNRFNTVLPYANKKSILLPNGYKENVLFSVKGTDYSFSRSSGGYRFNENNELVLEPDNVPRINFFNSDCPQLVIYPQITQLYTTIKATQLIVGGTVTSDVDDKIGNYYSFTESYLDEVHSFGGSSSQLANVDGFVWRSVLAKKGTHGIFLLCERAGNNSFSGVVFDLDLETWVSKKEDILPSKIFIKKVTNDGWFLCAFKTEITASTLSTQRNLSIGLRDNNLIQHTVNARTYIGQGRTIHFAHPNIYYSNESFPDIPIPLQATSVTKMADIATVIPEVGTTEIKVNSNTPITVIPATYQVENNLIDKIVMQ